MFTRLPTARVTDWVRRRRFWSRSSRVYRAPKIAIGTPRSRTATVTAAIAAVSTRLRRSAHPVLEPESHTAHGGDVPRGVGVVTELAAQPGHVHVQGLGGTGGVGEIGRASCRGRGERQEGESGEIKRNNANV